MDVRRFFGQHARRLRIEGGYTHQWIGEHVRYSDDAISKMESGERPPPEGIPEFLDELFQARGLLTALGHEARMDASGFPDWLEQEQRATDIRTYDPRLIPGLLQTEEYARIVVRTFSPWADEERVTEAVQARLERQAVLDRSMIRVVIEEAALERVVGGPQVQIPQLTRLVNLPDNVAVQIVPTDAGLHPGHDGPLTILRFAPKRGRTMARTESRSRGIVIDDPLGVARAERAFDEIVATALPRDRSAGWVRSLLEKLSHDDL